MAAEVNGGKKTEQLEGIHAANYAEIELAVVELRMRSDLHASAIGGSVGYRDERGGLKRRGIRAVARNLQGKRSEAHELPGRAKCIPAVGTNPFGESIRPACDCGVNANAGNAAEIMRLWGACFRRFGKYSSWKR